MDIRVEGMRCGHCERAVEAAVQRLDPDAVVMVDLLTRQVRVAGDMSMQQALEAIRAEGYEASPLPG